MGVSIHEWTKNNTRGGEREREREAGGEGEGKKGRG